MSRKNRFSENLLKNISDVPNLQRISSWGKFDFQKHSKSIFQETLRFRSINLNPGLFDSKKPKLYGKKHKGQKYSRKNEKYEQNLQISFKKQLNR